MLTVLGDLIPYAVPVSLSPLPIIAVLLLLLAPAGRRGAVWFIAGRALALAVPAFVVGLAAARLDWPGTGDRGGWLRVGFGLLLLAGAMLVWRRRPPAGSTPPAPGWVRAVEAATPPDALRFGLTLTIANPKELALVFGAGLIVGSAALPVGRALAVSAIFAVLASLGAAAPIIWAATAGPSGQRTLVAARDRLLRYQSVLMAGVLLLLGVMLIGSGIE